MELEKYRALVCVVETGSLSGAAGKLGYTPSAISRMIAALEEENGFTLFWRQRDGVRPTAACEQLLPAVQELLHCQNVCQQISAGIRGLQTGSVTVGTAYSASYAWISEAASDFHSQYPGIELQIRGGYSTKLLEALRARKVDLCFISEREGDHRWIPLQEDQVMAWIPKDSDLDKNGAVPVAAFAREPYIEIYPGMDIDNLRVLKACKVQPNTRFSTMDSYAACAMVEAGLGITMNNGMNRPTVDDGIKIVPLDPPQKVMVGIAAMRDLSPAAERFLDFLLKKQR